MPVTGERKVSVRFASPDFASALTCSSEMSQFFRRSRLDSASCFMPLCASPPASFRACTPCTAMRIFALGRDQFRAVDLEQRLALAHRLAGDIDVQALDIALELGRDRIDAALVRFDAAGGANHPVQRAQAGGFGPDAQLLHLLGADPDLVGGAGSPSPASSSPS